MVYPPVTGMLLTRYAPLRRSPARYCYLPLPLDLHVLSLPLAFILSQDQTLHSIFPKELRSLCIPTKVIVLFKLCCLSFYYFQWTSFIFPHCQRPALTALPVWDRKDTDFFLTAKFFFVFLKNFSICRRSKILSSPSPHLRAAKIDTFLILAKLFLIFMENIWEHYTCLCQWTQIYHIGRCVLYLLFV